MARDGRPRRALVAGAAGFIGSHLYDALLSRGMTVVGVDNFCTGRPQNFAHLKQDLRFTFVQLDSIDPLPPSLRADLIFNLACAASPPHCQLDPIHTMTNVLGTHNLLALASDCGARFVLASTSEVYGDPLVHPQAEGYWSNVNPIGPRSCYDEGKRAAESLVFDYLRAGRVAGRVARIFNTCGPRMRADDGRACRIPMGSSAPSSGSRPSSCRQRRPRSAEAGGLTAAPPGARARARRGQREPDGRQAASLCPGPRPARDACGARDDAR